MKKLLLLLPIFFFSCRTAQKTPGHEKLDLLARQYVKLGLTIGQYDANFVDAYYGPDSLKPKTPRQAVFPKDSLLASVDRLIAELKQTMDGSNDTLRRRANWMMYQLTAFGRRIKMVAGESASFDEESKELFGVAAPSYPEDHYRALVAKLDSALPGTGNVAARFQALADRFVIPKDKVDTVFTTALAECRKRTLAHYAVPANENFTLEYVTNKSWSGYNWYKGNYQSVIQINTDLPILIDRAIDVGSHESYPGHHVYNMLLEKNLYAGKGWVEISLYPLFSPQSLIAEGSANYGIELAFPGHEKNRFAKEVLLPLAGLDTAGLDLYFAALEIKAELNYARNEVGRGLINHTMTDADAVRWLTEYGFNSRESALKSISFIRTYRSYVINYNYGKDLVKKYIEAKGGNHWQTFEWLLSNAVTPGELNIE